ncbi:hypothetical protein PENSPDRAFT_691900 [Peniophora sp. CONT]|nr:hypothetical protein PENSPDRAFT_691900 [Peniophora sp. CONT]
MSFNASDTQAQLAFPILGITTRDGVLPLIFETFLMALFTVMVVYFLSQQRSRSPPPSKARAAIFYVALCSYTLAVINWAIDIHILWLELTRLIPQTLSNATPGADASEVHGILSFIQAILYSCIFTLSDVVLLWRAYVLTERPRWLLYTSVVVVVIEDALYVLNLISQLYLLPNMPTSIISLAFQLNLGIGPTIVACTAAVQAFASILITSRIWKPWNEFRDLILFRNLERKHSELLLLIAETGILYSLLWIWATISISPGVRDLDTAADWVPYYLVPISSIYPVAIVVIVSLRCSVLERKPDMQSRMLSSGTLRFARPALLEGLTEMSTTNHIAGDMEQGNPEPLYKYSERTRMEGYDDSFFQTATGTV